MTQSLSNSVHDTATPVDADPGTASQAPAACPGPTIQSASLWRPVVIRVVVGGLALLGLAGVGAASMLSGLDGARANPPAHPSAQLSESAATVATAPSAQSPDPAAPASAPVASANGPSPAEDPCNSGKTADGKVILNRATLADLRTLPNIGAKRAEAILALRDKLKRFHRVQELRRVRGIGAKTLQKLAPKLVVDPPPGTCPPSADAAKKT